MALCVIMLIWTVAVKNEPAFEVSWVAELVSEVSRYMLATPDRLCSWDVVISLANCSALSENGKGTEQKSSSAKLGRPTIVLKFSSRMYSAHQICTKVSFLATVAVVSSFLTCSPSACAERRAVPRTTQALHRRASAMDSEHTGPALPINTTDTQEVEGKKSRDLDLHEVWLGDQR